MKDNDDVFEDFKSIDEDGFVELHVVGGNPRNKTTSQTTNVVKSSVGKNSKSLTSLSIEYSSKRPQNLDLDVEVLNIPNIKPIVVNYSQSQLHIPDSQRPRPSSKKLQKAPVQRRKLPVKRKSFKTATEVPAQPPRKRPTPLSPPPPPKKVTPRIKHSAKRGPSPRKKVPPPQPQPQPAPSHTPQFEVVPPPLSPTPPQPAPQAETEPAQHEPAQPDPIAQETQLDPLFQETQPNLPLSKRKNTKDKGKNKIIPKRAKRSAKRALFIDEDELAYEEQPQ
ncbi:unnamed protein product [Amaranthus hypochondriacus]